MSVSLPPIDKPRASSRPRGAPGAPLLKTRIIRALRWTAMGRIAGQILTWVATLYVIRLLSPSDYGLVSMTTILIGLCALINELGAIPALVQKSTIDERLIRQVYGLVLVVNCSLYAAIYAGAPYYGAFFNSSELIEVTRVLALQLLIGSVAAVPAALLERDLQFKGYSIVEFAAMIIGAVTTLVLATLGSGVWALVSGTLAAVAARSLGMIAVTRFRCLPVFDFRGLGQVLSFGAKTTAQRIIWHLAGQADVFLIGKYLGAGPAGLYSVAANLAALPMTKVIGILNQVAFPAYSRLQDDVPQAKSYFLRSVKIASFIFFPALWGLSAVAPQFVEAVLGDQWRPAASVLQILALMVPFRVISNLIVPMLGGLGRPGLNLTNVMTSSILTFIGLAVGFGWGVEGTAIGLAIGYMAGFVLNVGRSLPAIGCRTREFVAGLVQPSVAAAVMYGAVIFAHEILAGALPVSAELVVLIVAGALLYVSAIAALSRDGLREMVRLLKACF